MHFPPKVLEILPKAFASHYCTLSGFNFEKDLSPTTTFTLLGFGGGEGVGQHDFSFWGLCLFNKEEENIWGFVPFLNCLGLRKGLKEPKTEHQRAHERAAFNGNGLIWPTASCTSNYSGYTYNYLCIYSCVCKCIYSHIKFISKEHNIHRNYFKPI